MRLDYKRNISNHVLDFRSILDFAIKKELVQARHYTKSQDKIIYPICRILSCDVTFR